MRVLAGGQAGTRSEVFPWTLPRAEPSLSASLRRAGQRLGGTLPYCQNTVVLFALLNCSSYTFLIHFLCPVVGQSMPVGINLLA